MEFTSSGRAGPPRARALSLATAWLVVTMAGGVDTLGPALQTTWRTVQALVPG